MKTSLSLKPIGYLLISGSLLLFIPYAVLTFLFDYPTILRAEAGEILSRFHAGGPGLIFWWFAFATVGLPLVAAYILIGQRVVSRSHYGQVATQLGVIGLIIQMIGLLRWAFVVPVLAADYVNGSVEVQAAAVSAFKVIHQFGGVLLGEHMGQLFTVIWSILISWTFLEGHITPRWLAIAGIGIALVYLLAQAELFATVIPAFPVWSPAGFIGSTLWLVWLVALGVHFVIHPKQS